MGAHDTETQAVLDVFKEAGLEVTLINGTDRLHSTPGGLISCVYGGRHRLVCLEACKWHQDRADTACKGCERCISSVPQKKPPQEKQFSLFGR